MMSNSSSFFALFFIIVSHKTVVLHYGRFLLRLLVKLYPFKFMTLTSCFCLHGSVLHEKIRLYKTQIELSRNGSFYNMIIKGLSESFAKNLRKIF